MAALRYQLFSLPGGDVQIEMAGHMLYVCITIKDFWDVWELFKGDRKH